MKRRALQLGLALVATTLTLEVCLQIAAWIAQQRVDGMDPADAAPQAITILCVGDSHTWGAGVEPQGNYPAQLGAALEKRYPGRPRFTTDTSRSGSRRRSSGIGRIS